MTESMESVSAAFMAGAINDQARGQRQESHPMIVPACLA
jgi:hypothetical protein